VSDLDHAVPAVRSVIADLFLQVLETGEAQSASGAMFSCANVIFAFTMNLPGGMDEAIRKGIGFNNSPGRSDVSKRVASEIKTMLSSAFLSRIGTPILFEPLEDEALGVILENGIRTAIFSAAENLHFPILGVVLDKGLGKCLIGSLETSITASGARGLLEHGRSLAAKAFLQLQQSNRKISEKTLFVHMTPEGKLAIGPI